MNKSLIKALIAIWVIIAVMLTGFLVYTIAYGRKAGDIFKLSEGSVMVQKDENISLDNCDKINLDFSSADIIVQTYDEPNLRVIQKSASKLREEEKFVISKENNSVVIRKGNKHIAFSIFRIVNFGQKIEIYVPKSYAKDLNIHSTSGNVILNSDIKLNSIKSEQSSGNFHTDYNINGNNVTLKTSSGNVNAENLVTKAYDINTSSGNIDINSLSGSGQVAVSSGNIKINYKDISEYSKVTAHSGTINLVVPKELSFEFDAQCNSGNINSNFDLNYKNDRRNNAAARVGDGPYKKISVSTSSGNINVSK